MPHDPVLVAEVRAWLAKAAKDLAAASYEMQAIPPFADDVAFHSQQAVEKTLKGFLAWYQNTFRKTHNLIELGEACIRIDPSLEHALRRAAPLTEYAWKFRYPSTPQEATVQEATEALAIARYVFDMVVRLLPPDVEPK